MIDQVPYARHRSRPRNSASLIVVLFIVPPMASLAAGFILGFLIGTSA